MKDNDLLTMLRDALDEIATLKNVNRLLMDELDEKDAEMKRLKRALAAGLAVSHEHEKQSRVARIKALRKRGLSSKAIELKVFGYKGGHAYRFVSSIIQADDIASQRSQST